MLYVTVCFSFIILEYILSNCKGDIGFLIDGSISINNTLATPYNWELIKDFIIVLGQSLNISQNGSHLAVVVFSSDATLEIKFSDFTNHEQFENRVIQMKIPLGATNTLEGFDMALNHMFNTSTGMRPNVEKTLIYLTDGRCSDDCSANGSLAFWGEQFTKRNIKTIGIGIGHDIEKQQIIDFVGSNNYYQKETFNQILTESFRRNLSICDKGDKLSSVL